MGDPKPEKPYRFDTISKPISQTDLAIWESTLWDYLKSITRYKRFLKKDLTWTTNIDDDRGFKDDEGDENPKLSGEDKSDVLDSILLKIGTYGPKSVFIDITKRSISYKYIWNAIRRACGFPVQGAQLIQYMSIKHSFDPSGNSSYNDHYWRMRDNKIASLMKTDSGITFDGKPVTVNEEITPSMENQVVADWLESIGGIKLVRYIGQEYAKELEKISLYDLQEVIGQQEVMKSIMEKMEGDEVAKFNRAKSYKNNKKPFNKPDKFEERTCYFCKELKNGMEKSHNTKNCFL